VAARLARVPGWIHSEHGQVGNGTPLRGRLRRLLCQAADVNVAVSGSLREYLAREVGVPAESFTVVRNGVDCTRFQPGSRTGARRRLGMGAEGLVIEVWVVGDGPLRAELEQLAREGTAPVRFLGHRDDVPEILPAFDIVALPSREEGASNTLLEAMASGLPVVASGVGGNLEVVADGVTGLLFPPEDEAQLVDRLQRLGASADARRDLGQRAARHVRERFSVEAMVAGYDRVYTDVMARRGRHRP
jgi:glycosyltransferase involved in cell wall biosynthesis